MYDGRIKQNIKMNMLLSQLSDEQKQADSLRKQNSDFKQLDEDYQIVMSKNEDLKEELSSKSARIS